MQHSSPLLLRSPLFAVAGTAQTNSQTKLGRLRHQRDALRFTETSAEAVRTAEAAVAAATEQAAAERARGGCKELYRQREAEERAAREALLKAQENRAATVKAVDLDGRIASAEEALNKARCEGGNDAGRSAVRQHVQLAPMRT